MYIERQTNLDLTNFHFPVTAIVSIFHRISGFILFLCMPLMFYLLYQSTLSEVSFLSLQRLLGHSWMKIIIWITLSSILFHLFSGMRHLAMDCGFGESVYAGRITACTVFIISFIAVVLVGIWIW
ncbi:succinate dehydrogenase, cytochrome b556 subunit [Coxiella endosymbiont of Amblyomma americanum]|uniref:succinate dehydrogenase, cytochrome b556 subunit n=1 Tax=Coxiella endosymbiont of Amblyomma americanum TaxID=325775 RepID=UPI00057FAB6A|nr:succinate dehydrogenase, cytochrome b556 subunit [Coxiella endosymbiont of Amblyomma americanum]AJC50289.1 succinate dehydrogenase [Coxiella endosymbiont of Amblyomma americanum]AUJ58641.1 succinate dehydrogenase, cytochrome b556 subunit [Coxiella-like endosymbiont of Amblyomma americanum]